MLAKQFSILSNYVPNQYIPSNAKDIPFSNNKGKSLKK